MSETIHDLDTPVRTMGLEECWEKLEEASFGRLGYRLVDEVHVVPINVGVDGRTLVFRTDAGNKLLAAALESDVAFEIDWYDGEQAWSVLARGHARVLGEDEAHRYDDQPPLPWVPTPKWDVVVLEHEVVTGRRFHLAR